MRAELAHMLAVAVVDRHAREHLSEGLPWVYADLMGGRRLDLVADRLEMLASDARSAADVTSPCRDHPREPIRATRPVWPATAPTPRVPSRRERLRSRAEALVAVGADVGAHRRAIHLPPLTKLDDAGLDRYEALLLELEVAYLDTGAPFGNPAEGVAA